MAGRILIVDSVATNRIVLKVRLAAARYETIEAGTGAEALKAIALTRPDLVVLDVHLPDIDGIEICRRLRATPETARLPVIVLSARPDMATRLAALHSGADDYHLKPLDETVLLARIRAALRNSAAEEELRETTCHELGFAEPPAAFTSASRIALIGAPPDEATRWLDALAPIMPGDRLMVWTREEALAAEDPTPDAYVIAADLARNGDGLRLLSDLRSRAGSRDAAICIAAAPGAQEVAEAALDLGASDLVPADFTPPGAAEEAALRLNRQIGHKRRRDRMRAQVVNGLRLAAQDPLTGLHNRRYALAQLDRIALAAEASGAVYAVMVLDIDRFKTVNDTLGHSAGDAVLVDLAHRLRNNLRAGDLLARIGGEEFLIALPDTTIGHARRTAEQLRRAVEEAPIALPSNRLVSITVSIGLAVGGVGESVEALIGRADRALLGCKSDGRNRVKVFRLPAA